MKAFERFLDKFKLESTRQEEQGKASSSESVETPTFGGDSNEQTIYFRSGKLYKISPPSDNWYNARFLVSDGKTYDLEKISDIKRIPVPNFLYMDVMSGYGVTGSLDYVLRMKAGNFYNRNEKQLCSACLWKATELMLANDHMNWSREDFYRLVYWHNELGLFEDAKRAEKYLSGFDQCTMNPFDYIAMKSKNIAFSRAKESGSNLVAYQDVVTSGCCSECAKHLGRVYSIGKRSLYYPQLPKYAMEHGNFHPGCRCMVTAFMPFENEVFHKGKKVNAKIASRRPWIDDRDDREKALYLEYLERVKKEEDAHKNRLEYSIKKGRNRVEFDAIVELIPEYAPKSLTGYTRMKTTKSKNFMKLYEAAKEKGIEINL